MMKHQAVDARRVQRTAAQRDLDMRSDILRIVAMKDTIRLKATVGPVGEGDIAERFGLSMVEAWHLLNGMIEEGDLRPKDRKRPDWLEQQNARWNAGTPRLDWQALRRSAADRFAKPHWGYFESLSWAAYRDPGQLGAITSNNIRSETFYGDGHWRKDFQYACQLGRIQAFRRDGSKIPPAAWVDLNPKDDPYIVFESAAVIAMLPADFIGPKWAEGNIEAAEYQGNRVKRFVTKG
jgi:hypothetical protein